MTRGKVTTVRVGAIVFTIIEVDGLRDDDGSKLDGHILHNDCEILIEVGLSEQARRQVLWHEIIHSLLLQSGAREHNEGMIEALSFGIFGVLQDNEFLREPVVSSDN